MTNRPLVAVVDDDPSVRNAVRRLLHSARLDVETYASGEAFLLALPSHAPDCLVLDVRMPGITGPELRDRLHDDGRSIPIVFITAHHEELPPGHGAEANAVEVLLKPFNDEDLLDAIARAIRKPRGSA